MAKELMLLNYDIETDSWESPGLEGDQTSQSSHDQALGEKAPLGDKAHTHTQREQKSAHGAKN